MALDNERHWRIPKNIKKPRKSRRKVERLAVGRPATGKSRRCQRLPERRSPIIMQIVGKFLPLVRARGLRAQSLKNSPQPSHLICRPQCLARGTTSVEWRIRELLYAASFSVRWSLQLDIAPCYTHMYSIHVNEECYK